MQTWRKNWRSTYRAKINRTQRGEHRELTRDLSWGDRFANALCTALEEYRGMNKHSTRRYWLGLDAVSIIW